MAPKIGCVPQMLLEWGKRAEVDSSKRPSATIADAQCLKELKLESKELPHPNDILRAASTSFAQAEFDCKLKS